MMPIYSWFISVSFCKLLNDCYRQLVTTAWSQLRNNSFRQLLYIPLMIAEQLHQLKVDVLRLFNNRCSTTVYQQLLDYSYRQLNYGYWLDLTADSAQLQLPTTENCALFKAAAIYSCLAQLQLLISDSCQHLLSTVCQWRQPAAMSATNSCLITAAQSQMPAAASLMAAAFIVAK